MNQFTNRNGWAGKVGIGVAIVAICGVGAMALNHLQAAGHPVLTVRVDAVEKTMGDIDTNVDKLLLQSAVQTAILERIAPEQ